MTALFEFAPAKINLALQLIARRDDGYHELDSTVAFLDFGDVLLVSPSADGAISLAMQGEFADGLSEEDNLVMRAAKLLQAETRVMQGAALTLEKHLPIGAGLGGGSADAAATLRLLNRFWKLDYSLEELAVLGARLGADVPACVYSKPLRMRGIGEQITLLHKKDETLPTLLLHPGTALMTAEVYRACQLPYSGALEASGDDWFVASSNAKNDLESSAFNLLPELPEMLAAMCMQAGCRIARMSGSGSACFAVFEEAADREKAAASLQAAFPKFWIRECSLIV